MLDVADSNAVYYYHFDGLGSVAALSDVNNVVVESYSYDVFGAPTIYDANNSEISSSAVGNPYLFTARRADNETALYYYRARYYAFDIGRFLQTDPIGYDDGMNTYAYVGNNPLAWRDPVGLCKEGIFSRAYNRWEKAVQSSSIGTSIGAFTIGLLERVYDLEQKLKHPAKNLGEWTVNTLEGIYDLEVEAYNMLYDLGYHGTSSQFYRTWSDIGSGQSTLGRDVGNIVLESDLLSADPYTAGNAWGSLTADEELRLATLKVASSVKVGLKTAHTNGPWLRVSDGGKDIFGADWHRFKHKGTGKMVVRPHYHRGKTKSQFKKHRPWEGGF